MTRAVVFAIALGCASGCTTLGQLRGIVQAPRFSQSADRPAEVRLLGRDSSGGALAVRLWATVANPNPFGFTLSTLRGTLFLDDSRGAADDFPLGLPLRAGEEAEVPLDLTVSLSDVPGLARVVRDAAASRPIRYRLDGAVGVDAGNLGQPIFGPMTLMTGELRTR